MGWWKEETLTLAQHIGELEKQNYDKMVELNVLKARIAEAKLCFSGYETKSEAERLEAIIDCLFILNK